MSTSHRERVASLQARIDDGLEALVAHREPDVLYDPIEHVLQAGGKRVRPVLLLLVAEAYGASLDRALPAALAVEVFHNFTLVHDDLMDDADERRGHPTVHVEWTPGSAILTGDMMMGLSYELLGRVDGTSRDALYGVYHPMVERLCTGQALDTAFETDSDVSVAEYLDMIDRKTGALLSATFEIGGIIGGASESDREALATAGRLVGRAFQIQDDLLDVTAEDEAWGKAVGGDLVAGKKTFVTLSALERAEGDEHDWFERLLQPGGLSKEQVPEARRRMSELGVFEEAREAVSSYTDQARKHLKCLPGGSETQTIAWLLRRLEARDH